MLRKEDLKIESEISENIRVLILVGKDKVKGVGVLLLMCDTPLKKCVASNNTFFAHESEI